MNRNVIQFCIRVVRLGAVLGTFFVAPRFTLALQADCAADCGDMVCAGTCCRAVCCPTVKQVEEEKSCWNVKCENIPVPAITLPWEPGGSPLTLFNCLRHFGKSHAADCSLCCDQEECCDTCCSCQEGCCCGPTRCGTVRCVRVLDEETCDVSKCETTWEVQCVAPCCSCAGNQCCDQ
jgi:hypothetical protein